MKNISVIIPVGDGESELKELLFDLKSLGFSGEVILSIHNLLNLNENEKNELVQFFPEKTKFLWEGENRAEQMNLASQKAKGEFLWFLHADSRLLFSQRSFKKLCDELKKDELYYFKFRCDYSHKVFRKLTHFGVELRSKLLKLPFGDQGFLISKKLFFDLRAYPENCSYGEDHLLVWKLLQSGKTPKCTGLPLQTSARKYEKNGWGKMTGKHLYLTYKQAFPEFKKLIKKRSSL